MNLPGSKAFDGVGVGAGDRAQRLWLVARFALPLAALLWWWSSLTASFQFDDWNVIVHDARVQSLAAWAASMPGIRPVLKLSYALNHSLGSTASGFRCVNLLIHGLNTLLVAALFRRRALAVGCDSGSALFAGSFVALVFALHPAQTEAVTYISGRSSSLTALFCLAALYAWLRARDNDADSSSLASPWRALALGAFLLALGTKETAMVLPLLLWLWVATQSGAAPIRWRELRYFLLGSLLMIGLALFWTPYRNLLETSLATRSVFLNLLTQAHALFYLTGQMLWPLHLNADPQLPAVARPDLWSVVLLLVWLVLAVGALIWRRRWPELSFGLLWFLICLLPTNSILPRLDVANDRQLYLALPGPAWCLGLLLLRCPLDWLRWLAAGAIAVLLGSATLYRNRVYANEIVFWQDVAAQVPGNARAANNLGMAYAMACRDAEADREFRRSIALQPGEFRARINLRLLGTGDLLAADERHCKPN